MAQVFGARSELRAAPADAVKPGEGRFAWLLASAAWIGLVGACGELLALGYVRVGMHEQIRVGMHVLWLTPLADLVLALLLATLVALLGLLWRPLASPRVAVTLLTLQAAAGALLVPLWSVRVGPLVLALGIAVQAGRLVGRDPARFQRLVVRTLPVLSAILLVIGAGYEGLRYLRERRALQALPAARADAPNVLLVVWDAARAASMSAYGYGHRTTPQLERLAARGVSFDAAVATAPWTLPSHASLFTGRFPSELSTSWHTGLDAQYPTLAEVLARHGYQTAGFVANTIYASYEFGLDRGFVHYADYDVSPGQLVLGSSLLRQLTNARAFRTLIRSEQIIGRKSAADVNAQLLGWLDGRRRTDRPFFAFLNEFDAHEPYLPPPPFDTLFGRFPRRTEFSAVNVTNSASIIHRPTGNLAEAAADRAAYEGGIAYLDAQLARLLDALRARGLLDNTLVILTSDHGEEFGRRGVFTHGNSLFYPVLHVPLVLVWPRQVPPGLRISQPVSLADLTSTVVQLLGIPGAPFPGRSLARFWQPHVPDAPAHPVVSMVEAAPTTQRWYPVHGGSLGSVIADGYHLIRRSDGRTQFFDVTADPLELRDLAGRAEFGARVAAMTNALPPGSGPAARGRSAVRAAHMLARSAPAGET